MTGKSAKSHAANRDGEKYDNSDLRLGDLMRGERATLGKSLLDVQRELRIKAAYIVAIENADVSVFETPGFVAGHVRSYARYLGMDPDDAFRHFCRDANFMPPQGMAASASRSIPGSALPQKAADPLANPNIAFAPKGESILSRIEPGAVGSLAVLTVLIGAIGYGGWSILREVQRVQLAPVDEPPSVTVQIDPLRPNGELGVEAQRLAAATAPHDPDDELTAGRDDVAGMPLIESRLHRPEALNVPILTSRNGPIASIDPSDGIGGGIADSGQEGGDDNIAAAIAEALSGDDIQVTAAERKGVEVLAVRPAWVRVTSEGGTILLEKILDSCETYTVPALEKPARIRIGNSGGVYFMVDGATYGPAAPGQNVVKDIVLSPDAITERYAVADLQKDRDLAQILTADASGNFTPGTAANCLTPSN